MGLRRRARGMMLVAALVTCWLYDRLFGLSTLSGGETSARMEERAVLRARSGDPRIGVASPRQRHAGRHCPQVIGTRGAQLLLAIYCALALAFLVLPTLLVIPIAFTSSQFLEFPPPGYSLQWFETYFSSPLWLSATLRSFGVAARDGAMLQR